MAIVGHEQAKQSGVVDDDQQQPDAQRHPAGGRALAHQGAEQVADGQECRAKEDRGAEQRAECCPGGGAGFTAQADRKAGGAVAQHRRYDEEEQVAQELAEHNSVVGQQQSDQRNQEHGQASEAHHGHRQLADLDCAGRRAAEQRQRERQHGQQQRRRQDPAVAQAVLDLLQRDHGHWRHAGVP